MVNGIVLVIGAGSIGKRHAENLERLGAQSELIPWRAFDPDKAGGRKDVIGMVIATATQVRLDLIRLCGQMNWPFYVEKPLAWRSDQVAEIYRVAAPVAARSMVGFMMRYHPAFRALGDLDLSDTYGFHFEIGHDVRQWRQNWRFGDSYAARGEGGGVLLDLCHELDMAQALFPGLGVQSVTSQDHTAFHNVDFATCAALAAPDGPVGSVVMDYLSPVSLRRASLRSQSRLIDLNLLVPALTIETAKKRTTRDFEFERNDMFLEAMRDFLALVGGRDPVDNSVDNPVDNPLMPRFDRMRGSCDLIALAWQARRFTGRLAHDMG